MSFSPDPLKILVAPLDWGLGHTTRCIPLIRALRKRGCDVIFAGEGEALDLISREFPDLSTVPLEGYRIHYQGSHLSWSMIFQIPGILRRIRAEHQWLETQAESLGLRAVISDNRWGLYHKTLHTVFITHQLYVNSGLGKLVDRWVNSLQYRFISRFSACWVPDLSAPPGLAGILSHPPFIPHPFSHIGILSRFGENRNEPIIYDWGVVISGPEPQRTHLENLILPQLLASGKKAVLVSGRPGRSVDQRPGPGIRQVSHLPARELERVLAGSRMIICRSGYSSVMDLVRLGKMAVLIPTPGQPEQEYLARHLMEEGWFFSMNQNGFNLEEMQKRVDRFKFREIPAELRGETFGPVLDQFLEKLGMGKS